MPDTPTIEDRLLALELAVSLLQQQPAPARAAAPGYVVPACFAAVDGFSAALAGWIESRRKLRKPPTGRAIQLLINRLAEQPHRAVAALDMCTERGHQPARRAAAPGCSSTGHVYGTGLAHRAVALAGSHRGRGAGAYARAGAG
jgi:hypothetical protein